MQTNRDVRFSGKRSNLAQNKGLLFGSDQLAIKAPFGSQQKRVSKE
jgi:hypothetical protein